MLNKTILIALGIYLLSSCKSNKTIENNYETFPVTTVISKDTSTYTEYVAEIHAEQNVEIRARVNGYLDRLYVDEGAFVKEGQLLFTINNKEYVEELAKAKALYKNAIAKVNEAELELKNVIALSERKIVSNTEVALAKNKLEAQKANVEESLAHQSHVQIKLDNTKIKAPFSGIINRIPHKIGSLIEEGTLLTTISENDEVYAYFDVSEKEYLNYARNLKRDSVNSKVVSLILADGKEHEVKGLIETIEGEIDENTGNIAFRAKFSNPDKIVKHGASGKIRLAKKFEDAILIPQKSTFEIQDKLYVYVLNKHNKLEIRNIEIKHRLPHLYIVAKGLKPGENILFEGLQNVKNGMSIKAQYQSMLAIINNFEL
ncbi:MAG TPA: efflux RND transporter periplasmic adaptor subunit [Bacteroidia bacterium]|jgi:membrane fusion protein (multidrug efflux system)|nr:efflux RND transporter periplasmic adaptor subunit [Bacteroidia bacterium]